MKCWRVFEIHLPRPSRTSPDGKPPIKITTTLGGAVAILAFGAILCISVVLITGFYFNNSLASTALLTAELPTLEAHSTLSPHVIFPGNIPARILPGTISSGILLGIEAQGPSCGAASFAASGLLAGSFVTSVTNNSGTTGAKPSSFSYTFYCPRCAFGLLSSASVTFPPTCQSYHITATVVSVTGGFSFASFAATGPIDGSALLAVARVTVQPQLQVVDASVEHGGQVERGYTIGSTNLQSQVAAAPISTQVLFDLSVSSVVSVFDTDERCITLGHSASARPSSTRSSCSKS